MSTAATEHNWYDGLVSVWDSAVEGASHLATRFNNTVNGIRETIGQTWDGVVRIKDDLVNGITETVNSVVQPVRDFVDDVKQGIEDRSWAITHPFQSLAYAFTEAVLGTENAYRLATWVKEKGFNEAEGTLFGSENLGEGITRWETRMREDLIAQGKLPQPSATPA